ncbi:ATP-binding cassette domain-containing protein [Shewanella oneidensis MR-1]|uniref:Photoreactivation-associated protein PhrA n=1 Tax=Shewanella oneidensis (strain ATCC 700550 / JCM 31522 / CIP 106686 / LMG 19005 / NCIMB 14063 / MR-1) TaxID=211586 RepID=Q8EIV4_SHEON|nr:ATP-binding cassette domain-containing protein [Shewanella oneidensis]AAN53804.2 photoreactivation-associated protein PhrA [Shewanella oneidensis MR-1]MDX5997360.1 ATP-binding cassette domain-containing protein [Shewanella oneidensis]MEE2030273.1 ABC transporter ATP-binding protein ModF [Shewanella oneidensis]QKG95602.1 ATP-binding cassette domain-containing protein [Shewanella oneidensis MR-1]
MGNSATHGDKAIAVKGLRYGRGNELLVVDDWQLMPMQHWAIFATDSYSGSLLGRMLAADIQPDEGQICNLPARVGWVSLGLQQALLERELAKDELDYGSTVEALVLECCQDSAQLPALLQKVGLEPLRQRGFRQLSTGETRRVMLARALAMLPQLLILDDPYAGLDAEHQGSLSELLCEVAAHSQLLVITSRQEELPPCISHVALFNSEMLKSGQHVHKLSAPMSIEQWHSHPVMAQLNALSASRSDELLALMERQRHNAEAFDPLVEIKNGKVEYVSCLIFKGVNWRINAGQHWQVRGPNGCGKSTLLGLILGDHPQCYSNDITLFGRPRGSGESIWQIKQRIGIVSSALHLQYRVSCSALDVLLSGFYDSIGLYHKPTKPQVDLAKEWLAILHMNEFASTGFKQLDYGQQRLLLIGRALIKQPLLLILDEPYQGLDFINRTLVMRALEMIAEHHLSQLLYVSHHREDALPAIKNFVDFIKQDNGYSVEVSHRPNELAQRMPIP